ncbi:hypothetical protein DQR71_15425 [Salmonella enterica subsp. enterica serovar Kingston]|nr:hypothetical protein [Salmonella enterica subsp. enterica serovar Kingston]
MQPVSLTYRFSRKNITRCWQTEYKKLQLFVFTEQLRRLKAAESEKDITALLQWKKRPKSSSGCPEPHKQNHLGVLMGVTHLSNTKHDF